MTKRFALSPLPYALERDVLAAVFVHRRALFGAVADRLREKIRGKIEALGFYLASPRNK